MIRGVIAICAVTSAGNTVGRLPTLPAIPKQVAGAAMAVAHADLRAAEGCWAIDRGSVLTPHQGGEPQQQVQKHGRGLCVKEFFARSLA
jgi:hypothetical protein